MDRLHAFYRQPLDVEPDSDFDSLAPHVRFVLVAPTHPGNIGAAARAVCTMGFRRLAVVSPAMPDFRRQPEAVALAARAYDVLAAAEEHAELRTALDGVRCAYAMTGYTREFGPPLIELRRACEDARGQLSSAASAMAEGHADPQTADPSARDVAFVFGTERSGLTNDEVALCQFSCTIPADPKRGSLNLAQAVQVTAYEMRLALNAASPASRFDADAPAGVDALEGMYAHLEEALVALGYLDREVPRKLLARLRRMLARAHPTPSEVDIVRGICAAIIQPKAQRIGTKSSDRSRN